MSDVNKSTSGRGQETAILFLHAQTSIHPGSGTALGVVDLPVQRERHTQWPTIPGSAIKGVARDGCREQVKGKHGGDRRKANEDDSELTAVFGPGKVEADTSHAGAISFTDARILAYPVRSLRGVFAWVTCHAVLERFKRDLGLAGMLQFAVPRSPSESECKASFLKGGPLSVEQTKLVLEEFEFEHEGDSTAAAGLISKMAFSDAASAERFQQHLVILHDDDFTHFVRHATEVVARIGLDYEKKTVKKGALFYQEFLPAETLFYSVVIANPSRNGHAMTATDVLDFFWRNPPKYVQIGGDETIGKGICVPRLYRGKEEQS